MSNRIKPSGSSDSGVTLLVVEDEEDVRFMISSYLREEGHEVLEASNAAEAKRLMNTHAPNIRLVITDIRMPGETGVQLAKYVHRVHPEIPVLIVSGNATQKEINGELFLRKPFGLGTLYSMVERILTGGHSK